MAVVIQQLIDCDVSRVMFTCDPINADQTKLLITCNYGIGEVINFE
jgi:phosphoenolpyruvate synthase/pyruvate phosphate dikinase